MATVEEVDLVHCVETVIMAAQTGLIRIHGLEDGEAVQIVIHVDGDHFILEHHPVYCSGFVRAHLISMGEYTLKYTHIR